MLTELIASAETRAAAVEAHQGAPTAAGAAARARHFRDGFLPELRARQADVQRFASEAEQTVRAAIASQDVRHVQQQYEGLLAQLMPIRSAIDASGNSANVIRAELSADLAMLDVEIAQLQQKVSELTAAAEQADGRVRDQTVRTTLTWIFGVVNPLVKVIDEAVSLIQDGGLTEEVLHRTTEELRHVRALVDDANQASTSLYGLKQNAGDLTNGIQSLASVAAMVSASLANARKDLEADDPGMIDLLSQVAVLDIQRLKEVVA